LVLRWATSNSNSKNSLRPKLEESHHLPLYSILCAIAQGPHPNDIFSRDSQVRVSKLPKLGLSWLWGPIISRANLRLRWGLKQNCSPCRDISNSMWHDTCTQVDRIESWLLVVKSQIINLTPDLSFGHNCVSDVQMVMQARFRHVSFNSFPMI